MSRQGGCGCRVRVLEWVWANAQVCGRRVCRCAVENVGVSMRGYEGADVGVQASGLPNHILFRAQWAGKPHTRTHSIYMLALSDPFYHMAIRAQNRHSRVPSTYSPCAHTHPNTSLSSTHTPLQPARPPSRQRGGNSVKARSCANQRLSPQTQSHTRIHADTYPRLHALTPFFVPTNPSTHALIVTHTHIYSPPARPPARGAATA